MVHRFGLSTENECLDGQTLKSHVVAFLVTKYSRRVPLHTRLPPVQSAPSSLNACFPKAPAMMLLILPHVPAPYMCMRPFCQSRAEQSRGGGPPLCAGEPFGLQSALCYCVCGVRLGEGLQVRKGLGKASAAQQGLDIAGSVPGAGMR